MLRLKQLVLQSHKLDTPNAAAVPFYSYWKAKKCFRLQIPQEFYNQTLGIATQQVALSTKRLELIASRWNKEVYLNAPLPLYDIEISENLCQYVEDPIKNFVRLAL